MAVRLPSSGEILFYPDGSLELGTIPDLLLESYERRIPGNRSVLATRKERRPDLNEWGYDDAYRLVLVPVRVCYLERRWKSLPFASRYSEFTPENENERSSYEIQAMERSAEFGPGIQLFMKVSGMIAKGKRDSRYDFVRVRW